MKLFAELRVMSVDKNIEEADKQKSIKCKCVALSDQLSPDGFPVTSQIRLKSKIEIPESLIGKSQLYEIVQFVITKDNKTSLYYQIVAIRK